MKIARLEIQSFRGIPNHCSLDFRNKRGNVSSAIIYGGNGTGKSSIIDAIEFNLQARIERSKEVKNARRPSAPSISLKDYKDAHTIIEFDDNSVNHRDICVEFDQQSNKNFFHSEPSHCHSLFCLSPIVLRRNDIISFNICEVEQKQILLSEFFYDFNIKAKISNNPEVMQVKEEIREIKARRKPLIEELLILLPIEKDEIMKALNWGQIKLVKSKFAPAGRKEVTSSNRLKVSLQPKVYEKACEIAVAIDQLSADIKKKNEQVKSYEPKKDVKEKRFEPLNERYDAASKYLSGAFKDISNADYINNIDIRVANISETSFEILVTLKNGRKVPPERIFSEANYDLMILLLYVSLIRVSAEKGQSKVLVLDDVLQSVDASIRTKFMSYILREFNDWQLFITCHDRAWLNQLRHLFNNARHNYKEFEIVKWSFEDGPIIQENKTNGRDDRIKKAMLTNDINVIASTTGPFFEMICEKLSGFLNCTVNRNPEDKYTIGDLWKSVKKELLSIGLESEVKEIDNFMFIRNMVGCHYSLWAEETSDYEIQCFANAVQSLYEKTFCGEDGCMTWISGKYFEDKSCHCRKLLYKKIINKPYRT